MAGVQIDVIPDPEGVGSIKVFENEDGTITGYNFLRGKFYPKPYDDKPDDYRPPPRPRRSAEEIQELLSEIHDLSTVDDTERKLGARSLAYFGIKTQLSEFDGTTLTAKFYPYTTDGAITAYKCKTHDKNFYSVGDMQNCDPFGWEQAMRGHNHTLYITEGEDDAAALMKALMPSWSKELPPAIISTSSGATGLKSISRRADTINRRFKQVVLVFDQDDAGRNGVRKVSNLLENCRSASFELKDANDMVKADRSNELAKAVLFESQPLVSGKCVRSSDAWHLAETKVEWGLDWPWPTMTELTRGRRRGEVYYFGSGVKMGKSVVVDQLGEHCIETQDTPTLFIKPEESLANTLKRLAGKAARQVLWDPKIPYEEADFHRGREIVGDKAIIFDAYQEVRWADVKKEIRTNVEVCGVKDVFIDPLTCFTVGMNLTEANAELISIASEIASMAKELDFTAYLFCHLNAPQAGPSHERGGAVQSVQFSGSRAMMRFCHQMWGLEGNKDPDLPEAVRNTRDLVLLEDRNFGETGRIHLAYNRTTGMLDEFNPSLGEYDE